MDQGFCEIDAEEDAVVVDVFGDVFGEVVVSWCAELFIDATEACGFVSFAAEGEGIGAAYGDLELSNIFEAFVAGDGVL